MCSCVISCSVHQAKLSNISKVMILGDSETDDAHLNSLEPGIGQLAALMRVEYALKPHTGKTKENWPFNKDY